MAGIGARLVKRIGRLDEARRAFPDAPRVVDLAVVGTLVARAMRWARALQARFAAEKKARAALARQKRVRKRAERWDGELAELAGMLREIRREVAEMAPPAEKPEPDDCIDGKETAEVIGQICADLGVAATLMCSEKMARRIEAIAAKAHALLGGPDEPWKAPPIPKPLRIPTDEHAESPEAVAGRMLAHLMDASAPPPPTHAPDTG
jgi:hypothetical protein